MSPSPKSIPPSARPASPERTARDRGQSEQRLLNAVGEVLARDGFVGLGVNAVAKQAGLDKVLIYRYYGGLAELVAAWGRSGRFWPSVDEVLGEQPDAVLQRPEGERWALFLESFIDHLRQRPLTLEILAAEIAAPNELSHILDAEREAWGEEAARVLGGEAFAKRPHLMALTTLIVVGVQGLALRARHTRLFGGIDVQSEAGWREIKTALRATAADLFGPLDSPQA